MIDPDTLPEPGTRPAMDAGCTCIAKDGEPTAPDERWPHFVVRDCPIHGDFAFREPPQVPAGA